MICALLSNTYSLLLRVFAQIKSLTHDLPDTDDHMLKARYLLYISTPLVVPLPPSAPYMHIERGKKGGRETEILRVPVFTALLYVAVLRMLMCHAAALPHLSSKSFLFLLLLL